MNERIPAETLLTTLKKTVLYTLGLVLLLLFLFQIQTVVLLFVGAFILALALNPIVLWLQTRGVSRVVGTLVTLAAVLALFLGILAFVVPRLVQEASQITETLPEYISTLGNRIERWLEQTPLEIDNLIDGETGISLPPLLEQVGGYVQTVLNGALLFVFFLAITMYSLINPLPLLKTYLHLFPVRHQDGAVAAFVRGSNAVVGWLWSTVIIGLIESAAVLVFLLWLQLPGAAVWAALAFFAEFIPKVSAYIAAVPPILVALAIDPMLALWLVIFFMVLNEITGDVIAPRLRAETMKLHPVFILLAVLAMGYAFGFLGILIAPPIAGFVKAFWEEFYLKGRQDDGHADERAERMLKRDLDGVR
jgi:putative permease